MKHHSIETGESAISQLNSRGEPSEVSSDPERGVVARDLAHHAIYTKSILSIYDLWVLGISNSLLWKCPTRILRAEFAKNATTNHLDVGVGTGYYLDKCLSNEPRRVALLDLNLNSSNMAASRIKRFAPEIYHADVLDPSLELKCDRFDSISLNYLLHCLPGSIKDKSIVFANLRPYLNDKGVLFGSTILGKGLDKSYLANKLMSIYNRQGIFHNSLDNLTDLTSSLHEYFREVKIRTVGCVAIFAAKV